MKEIFTALRVVTVFNHEERAQEIKLVCDNEYGFLKFDTYKQAEDWIKEKGEETHLYQIQKFIGKNIA